MIFATKLVLKWIGVFCLVMGLAQDLYAKKVGAGLKDDLKKSGRIIAVRAIGEDDTDGFIVIDTDDKTRKYVVSQETPGWMNILAILKKVAGKKGKAFVQLAVQRTGPRHGSVLVTYAEEK